MNTLIKTLVAAVLLASAGIALSQDNDFGPGDHGPCHHEGMRGTPALNHLRHALHRLDLNDDQKDGVRSIMQELKAEIRPIMEETRANREQLRDLVTAQSLDQDAVAAVASSEGELAARRILLTSQAIFEIHGLLSEEQRAELQDMFAEHRANRRQRHAGHAAGEG